MPKTAAPNQNQNQNGRPPLEIEKPSELDTSYPNVLLYGPPKIGKSTAAASAPPRILYMNCDLPNALHHPRQLYGDRFDEYRPQGLESLIDVTNHLRTALAAGDCPWRTLVCDPMQDLYRIVTTSMAKGSTKIPLGVHLDAQTHIERFARAMCELPINTVWVAHEIKEKDESQGLFEALPAMGTTNPNPASKLMGMVDVIGYCGLVDREGQPPSYEAQLIAANGRRGGDRFNVLGKVRMLDLSEWLAVIADGQTTNNQPKGELT